MRSTIGMWLGVTIAVGVAWCAASPQTLHDSALSLVGGSGPCNGTAPEKCALNNTGKACSATFMECVYYNVNYTCNDNGGQACLIDSDAGCASQNNESCNQK